MADKKSNTGKVGRSSISGKYVPVSYAKQHPKTTEIEKIKRSGKK